MKTPTQPIYIDSNGIRRFKSNKIVEYLLKVAKNGEYCDLNKIASMNFSKDDQIQFAQLIGYSISGFGDLSFVDTKTYNNIKKKKVHLTHKKEII